MQPTYIATGWLFRRAYNTDWPQVSRLLTQAKLPLQGAQEALDNFWLAFKGAGEGEELVGSAGLERYGQLALLRSVAVATSTRGNGLGEELVRQVLDEAYAQGLTQLVLLTTTAAAFFPRFGFRPITRDEVPEALKASAEFSSVCPAFATVMSLDLTRPVIPGRKELPMMEQNSPQQLTEAVRSRYSTLALKALNGKESEGCGPGLACNPVSNDLYSASELANLPELAASASLGCGNPTALAKLNEGEIVLDLGSGGGLDVLLSARRVGPAGFAYGVDMTDEMLEMARTNALKAGLPNVAFLKGDITAVPLPDHSVNVILSNCVINLAAVKRPVLEEAYRLLKPGGRLAVSDLVMWGGLPEELEDTPDNRRKFSAWAGAIAGPLTDGEYRSELTAIGFTEVELQITRHYNLADLAEPKPEWVSQVGEPLAAEILSRFTSTFVRALKPL